MECSEGKRKEVTKCSVNFDFLLLLSLLLHSNPIRGEGHVLCQELYDMTSLQKLAVGGQEAQGGARGVQAETLTSQQLQASS